MLEKREIRGINYFKALLIISVIFGHLSVRYRNFMPLYIINRLGHGTLAVTCFFVISGFLAGVSKNNKDSYHFLDGWKNMLRHVKPLYLVYLLSSFVFLNGRMRTGGGWKYLTENIWGIIKNVFLVQSWSITGAEVFCLNGVSWYLSCMVFIWLISPLIKFIICKIHSKIANVLIILGLLVLIFLLHDNSSIIGYNSLFLRLLQFIYGMIIGNCIEYIRSNRSVQVCGLIGASLLLMSFFTSPIYAPITILTASTGLFMIFLFLREEKRNDTNRIGNLMNYIGMASGFIFLLHYPAVQIGCNTLYPELPETYMSCLIQVVVLFFISICIPMLLFRLSNSSVQELGVKTDLP